MFNIVMILLGLALIFLSLSDSILEMFEAIK